MFLDFGDTWIPIRDADPEARKMFDRHYSRYFYRDGRRPAKFVGPGEYIALTTPNRDALFVWRKFQSMDNQNGVNCAIFRNEGNRLSSELILEAEKIARQRWGNVRFYTYVNASKIRSNNPGCCFKKAGWWTCGMTKINKLIILEKL